MQTNFTPNDLIRFIYKETTTEETNAISNELIGNWLLREQYNELKQSYSNLPKVLFSPSKNALENIIKRSKSTSLEVSF